MKKLHVLLLGISLSFVSLAQEGKEKTAEERATHMTERLDSQVKLTADQKQSIEKLNLQHINDMRTVKSNAELDDEAKKARMHDLRKNHKENVGNVLTEEQRNLLKEQREARKEHSKHTPEERAKFKSEQLKEELGLTEEQRAKVESLSIKQSNAASEIRKNETLNDEQKKEQLQTLRKSHKSELESILNEEQLKKLKEMKAEKKDHRGAHPHRHHHEKSDK